MMTSEELDAWKVKILAIARIGRESEHEAERKLFREKAEALVVMYHLPVEWLLEPKVEEPKKTSTGAKRSKAGTVQHTAEELILRRNAEGFGMPYEDILVRVMMAHPNAKTNYNCMRWYSSNLKKMGYNVPKRATKAA